MIFTLQVLLPERCFFFCQGYLVLSLDALMVGSAQCFIQTSIDPTQNPGVGPPSPVPAPGPFPSPLSCYEASEPTTSCGPATAGSVTQFVLILPPIFIPAHPVGVYERERDGMMTKASGISSPPCLVTYLWIELISIPTAENHTEEEVGGVRSTGVGGGGPHTDFRKQWFHFAL